MKICHVCGHECDDTAELCPVCGADMTAEQENTPPKILPEEEKVLENPVLLATIEDVVSAEIFKDILRENSVLFSCDSEDGGVMKVTFGGSFIAEDLYVSESDFEKASELYEEFLKSEPAFDEAFFEDEETDS